MTFICFIYIYFMRCKVSNFLADGDINKRKGSKGLEHSNRAKLGPEQGTKQPIPPTFIKN